MKTPSLEGKLVRDKIPDIIFAKGDIAHTRYLKKSEQLPYLHQKLLEEVGELLSAVDQHKVKDELGDVLEVLRAIALCHDHMPWRDVENAAKNKRQLNGAFKKFICLISTESRK